MTKRLTALAQLIEIHMSAGITTTRDLAEKVGYSERAILKAKAELYDAKSAPECGTHPSAEPGCGTRVRNAPECGTRVRGTAIAPARAQNESFQDSSLREKSRERFVGKFVTLEAEDVSKLSEFYGSLKFPADLVAADLYLAGQRRGIDFSTPDSRIGQLHTYLARRNREPDRKPKAVAATATDWKRQMEIDAGVRLA